MYRIIHLKNTILHLWLHFLQIIFVIFQNFCWSITWTWIWSTSLFQTIFFSCPWATLIFIISVIIYHWNNCRFYLPVFPDPFVRRPRFFGFAGRAVFVPFREDKYPDCLGMILTAGIVVGFCIDWMNALNILRFSQY